MTEQAYWNGEPVNASRGSGVVDGVRVRVVRVFVGDDQFDLDDTDARAWRKVTAGKGSPRYGHLNVTVDPWTFSPDDWQILIDEWSKRSGLNPNTPKPPPSRATIEGHPEEGNTT